MSCLPSIRRHVRVAISCALAACASGPTAADAVALRILEVNQSAPADVPILFVQARIVNAGTEPLQGGGCERPDIAVDSLGSQGWAPIEVNQSAELISCIRAFTVDPGQSAVFQTWFQRPGRIPFPTGTTLRLRVLRPGDESGPTREFTL